MRDCINNSFKRIVEFLRVVKKQNTPYHVFLEPIWMVWARLLVWQGRSLACKWSYCDHVVPSVMQAVHSNSTNMQKEDEWRKDDLVHKYRRIFILADPSKVSWRQHNLEEP